MVEMAVRFAIRSKPYSSTNAPKDIEYDSLNDRMVVIGTLEQIAMVEESMKQFAGPKRTLEIFPLRANDTASVRAAIQSAFSDTPLSDAPSITVDESKQQLIVRATPNNYRRFESCSKNLVNRCQPPIDRPKSLACGRFRSKIRRRACSIFAAFGRSSERIPGKFSIHSLRLATSQQMQTPNLR